MALQTDIGSRIPEGAVRLTRDEALYHQRTVIKEWPSESEVAFLRYGNYIAGLCNLATATVMVDYFKKYLNAGPRTYLLSIVPGIFVPGFVGYMLTDRFVTENILLMKMDCPICHQMKFALSQFYVGIGYPALYSYVSFAAMATVTKSYPIPNLHTEAREFWKASLRIFKEGARRFHVTGLIQSMVVLFLPYMQSKELATVMGKLQEKEKASQDSTSVNFDSY